MQQAATSGLAIDVTAQAATGIEDFDAVVRLYWPRVFRYALASLRDRDAAESVAQDCFWKAWQGRERFRGECSLQTWLMQIAVNLVRDRVRSRRLQFWKSAVEIDAAAEWMPDAAASPEARAETQQQVDAVWRATAKLPEKQRMVFLLRFVEELDILEIAAVTGLKEGTVKIHLYRALETVRKRLGKRA
jgi:RNA polymerase sigma-70 factor (ECF subfamily)